MRFLAASADVYMTQVASLDISLLGGHRQIATVIILSILNVTRPLFAKNHPGVSCPVQTRAERLHGRELNPGHKTVRYHDQPSTFPVSTQHRKRRHGQLLGFRHEQGKESQGTIERKKGQKGQGRSQRR